MARNGSPSFENLGLKILKHRFSEYALIYLTKKIDIVVLSHLFATENVWNVPSFQPHLLTPMTSTLMYSWCLLIAGIVIVTKRKFPFQYKVSREKYPKICLHLFCVSISYQSFNIFILWKLFRHSSQVESPYEHLAIHKVLVWGLSRGYKHSMAYQAVTHSSRAAFIVSKKNKRSSIQAHTQILVVGNWLRTVKGWRDMDGVLTIATIPS